MNLKSMAAIMDKIKSRRSVPANKNSAEAAKSGGKDPADKLHCGAGIYAVQDSIERRIMDEIRADSD